MKLSAFIAWGLVAMPFLTFSTMACEGQCRKAPVDFLAQKYTDVLNKQLRTLSSSDRKRAEDPLKRVIRRLGGYRNDGVIDDAIFSTFRSGCKDDPPRRSPDEVCGSAKSIACYSPWGHSRGVFDSVHAAVVKTLANTFRDSNSKIQRALVQDVKSYCPRNCRSWEDPFKNMMLKWEQREHSKAYGNRVPNCLNGRYSW